MWVELGQRFEQCFPALQAFAPSATPKALLRAIHALSQPSPRTDQTFSSEAFGPSRPELWQHKLHLAVLPPTTLRLDQFVVLVRIVTTDAQGVDQDLLWSGLLSFEDQDREFSVGVNNRDPQTPVLCTVPVLPGYDSTTGNTLTE